MMNPQRDTAVDHETSVLFADDVEANMPGRTSGLIGSSTTGSLFNKFGYQTSLGINWKVVLGILVVLVGLLIGLLVLDALFLGIIILQFNQLNNRDHSRPRNVIMMVSDGFGPAGQSLVRVAMKQNPQRYAPKSDLALDSIYVGTSRTYSHNSDITDSAAGATAFSCGLKTYNDAVAMDPNKKPCGTVLEAAMLAGMATGVVATTFVTDATPAAFTAHAVSRKELSSIAEQMISMEKLFKPDGKHGLDVILGGGLCWFLPQSVNGSCREDGKHLVQDAENKGYKFVKNAQELAGFAKSPEGPVLGLFAPQNMRYSIDRAPHDESEPSLAEMAKVALDVVSAASAKSDKGFFLMIEGSRIDHTGHDNDAAAQIPEVLAYDDAVRVVLDFARKDGNTLVISTSDHETGGLTLGRDDTHIYFPAELEAVTASGAVISEELRLPDGTYTEEHTRSVLEKYGIKNPTINEIQHVNSSPDKKYGVNQVVNARALIGFSSGYHTGIDVNIYSFGPGHELLRGNHENTDIGQIIATLMDFDLAHITDMLRSRGV